MNLFLKIPKNCYLYFNLNSVLLGEIHGMKSGGMERYPIMDTDRIAENNREDVFGGNENREIRKSSPQIDR